MAYMDFHPTIHKMGDAECLAAMIGRDITEFEDMSLRETAGNGMRGCTQLSRVSLPLLRYACTSMFSGCTSLMEVNAPQQNTMKDRCYDGCTELKSIELNTRCLIDKYCFISASLETIILRDIRGVSELGNVNAFEGTPIANGAGYIYVPKKMLDGTDGIAVYEAATNWSALAGQFRYIEDYPEITGGRYE